MSSPPQQEPELLQISEIRYRRLFESARDGIVILDALTRKITDVNPFMVELLGYSHNEFVGKELWEIGLLRDTQTSALAFRELQEKGYIRYEDLPLQTKAGQTRPVEFISNIYDENGHPVIQCNIRDISERNRAEAAELESKRFLQSTLDALSSHIAVLDEDGTIIAVNQAWRQFAEDNNGGAVSCGIGANYLEVCGRAAGIWAEQAPSVAQGIRDVIASENSDFCLEYPCHSPREQRWFNVCVTRFGGEGPTCVAIAHENITARKLAEATLRGNETKFRTIFETAIDAIFLADDNGLYVDANPAACALLGLAYRQIMGRSIADFVAPSTRDAVGASFEEFLREGQQSGEFVFLRPDGSERQAEFRAVAGLLPGVHMAMLRDITDRKLAEQSLQQSEARFRTAISEAPVPIMIHREDGKVLHISKGWTEYSGYDIEDIPTIHDWVERAYGSSARMQQYIDGLYRIKATRDAGERKIAAKNGEERVWEFRSTPLGTFGDGQRVVLSAALDLTERKQAEQELSLGEVRYRSLIQATTSIVWSTPASGEFETPQTGWSDFTGHDWETHKGWGWLKAVHPDDQSETARIWAEAVESRSEYVVEHRLHRHDGEYRDMAVRAVPLLGEDGSIREWIGVHTDITDTKRAEESLRASEERFQNIVANVPGMVYQFAMQSDGSVEFPFVSEGCRELFQVEPGELRLDANSAVRLIDADHRLKFDLSVAESAKNLTPWRWEGRFNLTDGTTKWIQGASRPRRLPGGGTLWDGLLMDITARKQAEEERDRFFTLSLDMLAIADHNGYFKRLNPAFEATLGHSNADLMAKPFLEWVHPDDREATLEAMKELDAGASTLEFVNRYRCSDGSYRWLSWTSTPFEGLIYAAAHDVTSLKKAEEALQKANDELEFKVTERTAELSLRNGELNNEIAERQRSRQDLQDFIDAMSTLAAKVAPDGTFLIVNNVALEASGLARAQYMKTNFLEGPWWTFDSAVQMRVREAFRQAVSGTPINYDETIFVFGQIRTINFSLIPILNTRGKVEYLIAEGRDITELKATEAALQHAKEDAEAANLAKSEFLSRMSHELRTPLNAILGFGQLLSKQDFAPAQKERVQHILKAGRHLLDLINEVLEIARIEAGQMLLSMEPVHVRKTVQEVFSLLRPLAAEHGIELQGDDSPDLEVYVWADLQRLKQVLLNLCSNAIKYNRPQGTITVTCQTIPGISSPKDPSLADLLRINVTDTGMGMTPAAQAQLFVPFMRLGAEQTTIEGTGLGLALSLSIMHAMEGTIGVESTVGVGSTFWLQLPLTPGPLSVAEEALGHAVAMDVETVTASATRYTLLYIRHYRD